jgi:hypothetical protein
MSGMSKSHATASDPKTELLRRLAQFSAISGMSKSAIGKQALNDSAFVFRIETQDVTLSTYSKVMRWLDANWPEKSGAAP